MGADTLSFLATNVPTSFAVCSPIYRRCAICFWYHFNASEVFSGTLRTLGTFNTAALLADSFLPFSGRAAAAPCVYSKPGDSSMCCVGGGMSSARNATGDDFCMCCDAMYVA